MTTATTTEAGKTTEGQSSTQAAESAQAQGATSQASEQQASGKQTEGQGGQGDQQTGQKASEQKPEAGKTEGEQGKPQGAPEKYEFKAPEGQQFDTEVIVQFSEVAKDLNLTQDAAQKVLDKMSPVLAQRQAAQIEAMRTSWVEQAKGDKEFGGENFDANLAVARKARDQFATPEFGKFLDESGLGNHPEMIRMLHRVGKAVSEDGKFVGGTQSGGNNRESAAQRMYPGMNP